MATFKARIKGDHHWDDVEAETPIAAARKFAEWLHHHEHMFRDEDDDDTIVEIGDDWVKRETFAIAASISVTFDINPV